MNKPTTEELTPRWVCPAQDLIGTCGLDLGEMPGSCAEGVPVGCANGHRYLLRMGADGTVGTERVADVAALALEQEVA